MIQIFGFNGPFNRVLEMFGFEPVQFFQQAGLFRGFIIGSDVWKNFGYNSIIYLAALAGIDGTSMKRQVLMGQAAGENYGILLCRESAQPLFF